MNQINHRFLKLAKMNEKIFHANDLANIWQISDKNLLLTTLKRYYRQGLLYRIYKGLYALEPAEKIDPWLLGVKALHGYAYISCETVLAQAGIIQQKVNYITLVAEKSRRFRLGGNNYYIRQLKDEYLYNDAGLEKKNGLLIATPERAAADLLYFNPRAHFDRPSGLGRKKLREIQKAVYKK